MAAIVKELRQKRVKAVADARKIFEKAEKEKRSMSAEERGEFDKFMKEAGDLKDQIAEAESELRALEELTAHEREIRENPGRRTHPDQPRGDDQDQPGRRRVMRWKVASGQTRQITMGGPTAAAQYRDAYRTFLASGRAAGKLIARGEDPQERRDLQADADTTGGYLVAPMQMVGQMIKFLDDQVFIRQLATVHPVTTAQSLGAVSLDADPDDGEWTSEIATGDADTNMSFGRRELNPTLCSKEIKISRKLLRLSADVERLVLERLGYKFAVTMEKQFMTGDGAAKPLGLFVAHNSGIPTSRDMATGNSTTNIAADNLIRCKYLLKAGYRSRPTTRWIFHRDAMLQIALLKDGNGQYLWRQGLAGGEPDTVANIPVIESEFAPNTFTTGKYVGLLGDLSYYWIAEALGLDFQRLDELYAKQNKVGLIGRMEADAMPVLAEAFVRVQLGS